ncbi:MspI family type II restriction endonuclease [Streptococcus sp. GS001]|uniref:MspI family type II restriction endonuclease n=1 Tax=Streptococcus sp. GS001 TaxID=2766953 RepID=UPI001F1D8D80|nr:MspI family type II restriction endonuclease [Streptococcus sp. GS001]MCF4964909.1 MspI family type II restriction endonuclease [Streptococcus sp. GS001]
MSFNFDNHQKSLSGSASNLTLNIMLNELLLVPSINISVSKNYSIGYEGCKKQFKMDYKICFHDFDDEVWLIKSTSSIRSDRLYGNEFFAQNIKILDPKVTNIFVVIPDSVNAVELKNKNDYSIKIRSKIYKSFIDDLLTFSELRDKILAYASSKLTQGIKSNILGNNAEDLIVNLLIDKNNILLWNNYRQNHKTIKSSTYNWFLKILLTSGFNKTKNKTIERIIATNIIPNLNNGGKPKTDVMFTVLSNGIEESKTISIKHTQERVVTIHEGDVEDVIKALKLRPDSPLSQALRKFQHFGSFKLLLENDHNAYNVLENQLHKYNKELALLFLFGINSPLVNNPIQIPDMILYTSNFEVFSRNNFIINYIEKYASSGQLNTPFKWTYPSKKRGKKIQIKGFTNNQK